MLFRSKLLLVCSIILLYKVFLLFLAFVSFSSVNALNYFGHNGGKPRILLCGASNMIYNYDYELLNSVYPNRDIVGVYVSEPSGLYALLYKIDRLTPAKDDVIIFCFPHSWYEPDKYLPVKSRMKDAFTANVFFRGVRMMPLIGIKNSLIDLQLRDVFKMYSVNDSSSAKQVTAFSFSINTGAESDSLFLRCVPFDNNRFHIEGGSLSVYYLYELKRLLESKYPYSELLFRFPALCEKDFEIDSSGIQLLMNRFRFINSFESSIYEKRYFFDQWYHLNSCGRAFSTKKFLEELHPFLPADI